MGEDFLLFCLPQMLSDDSLAMGLVEASRSAQLIDFERFLSVSLRTLVLT